MGRDGRPLHTDGIQLYNTTHLVAAAGRTAGGRAPAAGAGAACCFSGAPAAGAPPQCQLCGATCPTPSRPAALPHAPLPQAPAIWTMPRASPSPWQPCPRPPRPPPSATSCSWHSCTAARRRGRGSSCRTGSSRSARSWGRAPPPVAVAARWRRGPGRSARRGWRVCTWAAWRTAAVSSRSETPPASGALGSPPCRLRVMACHTAAALPTGLPRLPTLFLPAGTCPPPSCPTPRCPLPSSTWRGGAWCCPVTWRRSEGAACACACAWLPPACPPANCAAAPAGPAPPPSPFTGPPAARRGQGQPVPGAPRAGARLVWVGGHRGLTLPHHVAEYTRQAAAPALLCGTPPPSGPTCPCRRLNWEDVMLGMLLEDATEPQDHPGAPCRACFCNAVRPAARWAPPACPTRRPPAHTLLPPQASAPPGVPAPPAQRSSTWTWTRPASSRGCTSRTCRVG